MPVFTDEEIKEKIQNGDILGVSVDTSVFDRFKCNLDFTTLNKLDQFKGGSIKVLLSEVVTEEVKRHITRDAKETQRVLKKAIKEHGRRWKQDFDDAIVSSTFNLGGSPDTTAETQLSAYMSRVGAVIVSASISPTLAKEILRRYFGTEAPFEENEQKKSEFPDGFALISLEEMAKSAQKIIVCVSADKGWQAYAAQSDWLVCVADLDVALSYFNESGRNVADQSISMLRQGAAQDLADDLDGAIQARLDDTDFEADGTSSFQYESEPIAASLQYVDLDSASDPIVVAADDEVVTFTMNVTAKVNFEASFGFVVRDGIDRDYVSLGSEIESVEKDIVFHVAITVQRNTTGGPVPIDVEVESRRIDVDFGFVDPFRNEDPTHEKY